MRYSKIKENDVANGEGVVVSVWTQGCPHHCKGCFNQETWDFSNCKLWTPSMNEKVLKLLDKNGVHRDLSILGGEPLCPQNYEDVLDLCTYIKQHRPNTRIYIWTGYRFEDLDLFYDKSKFNFDVLIDGRFDINKRDMKLKLRGSSNQRVIDVQRTIECNKIIEIIK